MKKFLMIAALLLSSVSTVEAARYQTVTPSGRPVVAHTRLAPVAVHRLLPPYGMRNHVTQREATYGR